MIQEIAQATGLDVYEPSISQAGEVAFFLARRGSQKLVGCVGEGPLKGDLAGMLEGKPIVIGRTSHANAAAVREALPWTAPGCVGLATSVGLGDRLGLAAPGHIRAVRGKPLAVVLAQQSIREMTRTGRTPDEVMDAATWGALQEGFRDGFGSDADHLQ